MPAEGLDWMPYEKVLTDAEVVRLVRVGVERLGITTVRLTRGRESSVQGGAEAGR
jgi:cyclic pyranopterin phosphate synthase